MFKFDSQSCFYLLIFNTVYTVNNKTQELFKFPELPMKQHPQTLTKPLPTQKRFHSDLSSSVSKQNNPMGSLKVIKAKKIIKKLREIKKCKKYLTESQNSSDSEVSTSEYNEMEPYLMRIKGQGQFIDGDERGEAD